MGEILMTAAGIALALLILVAQVPWKLWAGADGRYIRLLMDAGCFITTAYITQSVGGQMLTSSVFLAAVLTSCGLHSMSALYRARNHQKVGN